MNVEATRLAFRPQHITTLFVGESAPAGGGFFYFADRSAFQSHILAAVGAKNLTEFKAAGHYLDDLALTPVDKLPPRQRRAACVAARSCLARRIAEYRPQAIVVLLRSIHADVAAAVAMAGSPAKLYSVPFPGMGQQGRFRAEMQTILPLLPKLAS